MSLLKRNGPWVVGAAGVVCLALSAFSWGQRIAPPGPYIDPQAVAAASSLSQAFRAASQVSLPAIVSIETRGKVQVARAPQDELGNPFRGTPFEDLLKQDPRFRDLFGNRGKGAPTPRAQGMGSGFIIDSSGIILTANHVVADAEQVKVRLADGREFLATDVKTDPKTDIAIVRIQPDAVLPILPFGDSDQMEVGDWVLAIGSPFGLDATVTAGIISAKGRGPDITEREDFLQTDAAINPGNSGGPLINLKGEVVGINTAISTRSGGNDGVAFTVPINLARWVSDQLIANGHVTRAYLGIAIQGIDDKLSKQFRVPVGHGALVTDILPESPAANSGLEVGDLVIRFNGKEVRGTRDLQGIVERCEVGKSYPLLIQRNGKEQTLNVSMKEMPRNFSLRRLPGSLDGEHREESPKPKSGEVAALGLHVEALTPDVARQLGYKDQTVGVVITAVDDESLAGQAGLVTGMVIERVGQQRVTSVDEFMELAKTEELEKGLLLLVRTPRNSSFIVLKG